MIVAKRKKKLKKKALLLLVIILIGIWLIFFMFSDNSEDFKDRIQDALNIIDDNLEEQKIKSEKKKEKEKKQELYNTCLNRTFDESELSEEIINYENELTSYIKNNYRVSIRYEDELTGFSYSFNSKPVYYAASTIKLLIATYIYQKAINGEINLDDTITYQAKHQYSPSLEMRKHKFGEKIKIRDLVKFAVTVSDNSAYFMLLDYVGFSNLKSFGSSLGAKYTLTGGDNFGSIDVTDAIIYVQELNKTINSDPVLGEELKSYFINSEDNYLKIDDKNILAASKYGEYSPNFHNIGIVYEEKPYYIAILTTEFGHHQNAIQNINLKINELHNMFYLNRQKICHLEIYGS